MSFDRKRLAEEALIRSMEIRQQVKADFNSPLCIYDVCKELGIIVRFTDINMEGMYDKFPKRRIHLSTQRPSGRRVFNCAHELGHDAFGHGSTIDELKKEIFREKYSDPREFLADVFAGLILMPPLALDAAFASRGWDPVTATRTQMYTVACHFGVGYGALVSHLAYGVSYIPRSRLPDLRKSLGSIRRELLGYPCASPLIIMDEHWTSLNLDIEVGDVVAVPDGVVLSGDVVVQEADLTGRTFLRGLRQGCGALQLPSGGSVRVRVSRRNFVGLAPYRHDPDDDPEEEDEF